MRMLSISTVLLGAWALTACVSASSTPSFLAKEDEYVPFAQAILTIAESGPTNPDNIGLAGPAYDGIVHASLEYTVYNPSTGQYEGTSACKTCSFGGDGPLTQYLADLYLVADFGGQTLSGNLSNFFTPVAGFKNPNGTITLLGNFTKNGNSSDISFSGSDTLTGSSMTANYAFFDVYGGFGGTTGQIMVGGFLSNFNWQNGTYAGSTSQSDGLWVAQEQ